MNMHIGTHDPAVTAILYGMINGLTPSIINLINQVISIRQYHLKYFRNLMRQGLMVH